MATDVEASPKQSVMDYMKSSAASCNSTGKTKGIRAFFSASSKSTVVNHRNSDGLVETKVHTETTSQVHIDTTSNITNNIESELEREKDSDKVGENLSSKLCKESENEKSPLTGNDAKQISLNSDQGRASGREGTVQVGKKKSLSTSKKAKEKRADSPCVQSAVVNGQKEEDGVSEHMQTQSVPQEMDYGDFLKTLIHNQTATSPVVNGAANGNKEPSVQSCADSKEAQNCSEKRNAPPKLACNKRNKMTPVTLNPEPKDQSLTKRNKTTPVTLNPEPKDQSLTKRNKTTPVTLNPEPKDQSLTKRNKTTPVTLNPEPKYQSLTKRNKTTQVTLNPEEPKDQSQTKSKTKKMANAFSILMQPKADKGKEKCLEGDDCIQMKDATTDGNTSPADMDDGCSDQPEILPAEHASSTPSILNFYTKSTKRDSDSGESVIVEVDIHQDPSERKVTPVRKKPNGLQVQKAEKHAPKSLTLDSEIIFLGSETIEAEEEVKGNKRGSRKRNFFKPATPAESPKTSVTDALKTHCNKEATGKKNAFLQDFTSPDQSAKTSQPTLHFGQGGKLAMNTSVIAKTVSVSNTPKCDAENLDGTAHTKRSKQTKGKDGEKDTCSSETSDRTDRNTTRMKKGNKRLKKKDSRPGKYVPEKMNEMKMKGRVTRLRKRVHCEVDSSNVSMDGSLTDGREESGSDSKDFTPHSKKVMAGSVSRSRAHELLMKARQKKDSQQKNPRRTKTKRRPLLPAGEKEKKEAAEKSAVKKEAAEKAAVKKEPAEKFASEKEKKEALSEKSAVRDEQLEPEQGLRRSSRRLVEQQKSRQAAEEEKCISVASNSSDEDAATPQKKSGGKKGSSGVHQKNASGPCPNKPVGKLAPIFAKKTKEAADSTPKQPPENPEVVRRRREFLLSGVPMELKRQTVCAAPSIIASDFAPFPDNSHVQQKESAETGGLDVWSLGSPEEATLCKKTAASEEMSSSGLDWASLQWNPVVLDEQNCAHFKLSEAVCGSVEKGVKEGLMEELQQTHAGFPFTAVCDRVSQQLTATAVKQDTAPVASSCAAKKKRKVEPDVVIVDEPEDASAAQGDRDSQWSERLQPRCASDMIGNESCIRRLRCWLEEWRALIQREARLSERWSGGKEDSDFAYSAEDSEEEASHLCNTVMLVGPHGTGKTAAVYALAQQLSYKVFEVNASSSRQGRHIVAQLQEATQSHQVAQKKDGIVLSPPPSLPAFTSEPAEQPVEKKAGKNSANAVPKAFASFFKKSDRGTETKASSRTASPKADKKKGRGTPKKQTKKSKMSAENGLSKKRRRGSDDVEIVEEASSPKKQHGNKKAKCVEDGKEGEESNLAGCLNLTSTSLILFDEVDLVFEEDSGFLQTVQHFINTTKIPIILTTTDPHFQQQLNARMETLLFKTPPLGSVSSYLQTVCLAVGMRTDRVDVSAVAGLCRGDVRRALLTLQFLALSGGGGVREPQPARLKPPQRPAPSEGGRPNKPALPASTPGVPVAVGCHGSDSDGDFVSLKPLRKKSRRIVDDDDTSKSSVTASDKSEGTVSRQQEWDTRGMMAADRLPAVHLQLYQSVLGVAHNLHDLLRKSIQEEYDSRLLHGFTEECLKLKASQLDVLQSNLLQLLPLPKIALPASRWYRPSAPTSTAVKRKRIRSDIYDSEGSDDESRRRESVPIKAVESEGAQENVTEAEASEMDAGDAVCTKSSAEPGDETSAENTNKNCDKEEESKCEETGKVDPMEMNNTLVREQGSMQNSCEPTSSLRGSRKCTDHGLGSRLLSSFAKHYDSLSAMDAGRQECFRSLPTADRCLMQPGIEDVASVELERRGGGQWREEVGTEGEVLSSRCLWQQVSTALTSWREQSGTDTLPEDCSLPVASASPSTSTLLFTKACSQLSVPEVYSKVVTDVMDKLPCHIGSDAVTMDYLPTLRCISRAECCRQIAKTKRRFHHHFDSIGLCLNRSTVTALSADFPAEQPPV